MRRSRLALGVLAALIAPALVPIAVRTTPAAAATPSPSVPAARVVTRLAGVTGLQLAPSAQGERLRWTDPASAYSSLVVRRATGTVAPASPTSGSLVATLQRGLTALVDGSVEAHAIYSYAVFAVYPGGKHAAPASSVARTSDTAPSPATGGTGSFTGTVTDTAGHRLQGVQVVVSPVSPVVFTSGPFGFIPTFIGAPRTTRTGLNGTFTVTGINAASYTLCYLASTRIVTGSAGAPLGYQDDCPSDAIAGHLGVSTSLGTTRLAANTGGLVSGVVLDAISGAPLAGVQVDRDFTAPLSGPVRTNANGAFRWALPAGSYLFCFDAEMITTGTGYVSTCSAPVTVSAGQVSHLTVPLARGGVISGVVRSSVDGSPVAGVQMSTQGPGGFAAASTGADGSYTLYGLLPAHRVQICADGFFSAVLSAVASAAPALGWGTGCTVGVARRLVPAVAPDIALAPAGGISGRITTTSGHPLSRATVSVMGRRVGFETFTQPDGTYLVTGVPAGTYTVCMQASSYPAQCYRDRSPLQRLTPLAVTSGVLDTGVDATMAGGDPGRIVVTVRDPGGHALVGADVAIAGQCAAADFECSPLPLFPRDDSNGVASELTGSDGTVTISGLAPGSYVACVFGRYAAGGTSTTRYQDTCTGSTYSLVVTAGGTLSTSIRLLPGAAVSGTVTDSSGHPLAGVVIYPSTGDAADVGNPADLPVTGADGTYRLEGLPGGTATVCFDASQALGSSTTGYASLCWNQTLRLPTPITVTNGVVTTGINAKLPNGSVVQGTVTDSGGQPLEGVHVMVSGNAPTQGETDTGADGTYRVASLSAGNYTVCFYGELAVGAPATGYVDQCWDNVPFTAPATQLWVPAARTVSGIGATLQVGAEITGQINAGGAPLADGFVELLATGPAGLVGLGEEALGGAFDFIGLPAGSYAVCADGSGVGYGAACAPGLAWDGQTIPAGATLFPAAAGQTVTVTLTLPPLGP